jgi:hypothetical protein
VIARVFCFIAIAGCLGAQGPAEDWTGLLRTVLSKLQEADARLGEYGYDRFSVRRELDSSGAVKSERTILARRAYFEADDLWVTRQVERNGKPVSEEELQRNLESARQRAAELKAMSPEERAKLNAKSRDENAWLKEFPQALEFRKTGEETIDGRPAIVLEFSPRPGYKASNLRARVFSRVRGKMWIDSADSQLVRAEAEVFENVNIGWGVVGRVQKGTRFHLERRKIEDGSWLPQLQTIRFAARVLVFKSLAQEETTRYSQYRSKSEMVALKK